MRFKLLLIILFCAMGMLRAQDTIRTLIISEARIDAQHGAYVELTNVGATALNLADFEFGKIGPWTVGPPDWKPDANNFIMLPNKMLAPGKSFVMARVSDYVTRMWEKNPDLFNRYESKPEFNKLADMQIHSSESPVAVPQSVDSISTFAPTFALWDGAYCWYLRYHYKLPGDIRDSVIVDQVNGIFNEANGTNKDSEGNDVAGYTKASNTSVLIRKNSIKKGNVDYNTGRGTNEVESEWIVVPFLLGGWEPTRAVFWTVGNHGDYHLSSLNTSTMTINWTDNTLTVPWGIRNDDSIMSQFARVPGIAWHYDYAENHADSAYVSVRTGDKLTVYACGNVGEKAILSIIALPPTASDNKVIPKKPANLRGWYPGAAAFCEVTDNVSGMDTIRMFAYGTAVDTLLKYLEKPAKASWDIIWVDGVKRADVKKGDILKVTSENGAVKQYYIKPNRYFPSHNAYLSSITWPEIPDHILGLYGWLGDTIPSFVPSKNNYKLMVPWDVDGIPGLVGRKQQFNSTLQVKRAANLTGSVDDRTITFTNTAEDDTTIRVYNIELIKEIPFVQSWRGEPLISQYVWQQDWKSNDFLEIVNPGTEPINLSNYMITFGYSGTDAAAITQNTGTTTADFQGRYRKYIPGYKWANDEATWAANVAIAEKDNNVKSVVLPGDVFVAAWIDGVKGNAAFPEQSIAQTDIEFRNNPWGVDLNFNGSPWDAAMRQWSGQKIRLFKILNDSIRSGLKPANDPNDFELVDIMGMVSGDWMWKGAAINQRTQYIRKPNIFKGNPVVESSFGTTPENSEWLVMTPSDYSALGYGWPTNELLIADNIGSHFMNTVTIYKSTVSSSVYKVSDGYTDAETLKGTGVATTVAAFLANIVKADTGQHLKVRKFADGSILSNTDLISNGDTLIVVSSDSVNTTKYIIDAALLSNNAVLTSSTYTVGVNGSDGTISNFAFGVALRTLVEGLTVPDYASMIMVDANGAYQSLKTLQYDTTYVDVLVNDQIQLIVTAEDGITKIVYLLKPTAASTDAFILSNIYLIDQANALIEKIPASTSVEGFLPNLIPATGASIKLYDKAGLERTVGYLSKDDRIVVTAADGVTTKSYYFVLLGKDRYYAAYLLSAEYNVNQVGFYITGNISTSILVSELLAKLELAPFASVKCFSALGIEKAGTDNIAQGDIVRVTSGDAVLNVDYVVSIPTFNPAINGGQLMVYPNPSVGNVFVSGIESGNRICVYNTLGELVIEKVALQSLETIVLNKQPKGVYLIKVVTKDNKQVTTRKIILK